MIVATPGILASYKAVDTDAQAFITATGITDNTQKNAINQLVLDLKTYGIWTEMNAIYPFVGGTATAHKFNLKDPRDLDATYRLVFAGGWTHSSTGAKPNGTDAYADTKFSAGAVGMSASSFHMSYYARTAIIGTGSSKVYMGVENSTNPNNNFTVLGWLNSGTQEAGSIAGNNTGSEYSPSPSLTPNTAGFKSIITNGNRNARYYRNGTYQPSQVTQSYNFDNFNIYIAAVNRYNTTQAVFTNVESAFASIGNGLSDTDAANFYTAVQTFQTTLGRQV
jgi:hypothetical protein